MKYCVFFFGLVDVFFPFCIRQWKNRAKTPPKTKIDQRDAYELDEGHIRDREHAIAS